MVVRLIKDEKLEKKRCWQGCPATASKSVISEERLLVVERVEDDDDEEEEDGSKGGSQRIEEKSLRLCFRMDLSESDKKCGASLRLETNGQISSGSSLSPPCLTPSLKLSPNLLRATFHGVTPYCLLLYKRSSFLHAKCVLLLFASNMSCLPKISLSSLTDRSFLLRNGGRGCESQIAIRPIQDTEENDEDHDQNRRRRRRMVEGNDDDGTRQETKSKSRHNFYVKNHPFNHLPALMRDSLKVLLSNDDISSEADLMN